MAIDVHDRRRYAGEGYTCGHFIPGPEWLCVPGSALRSQPLFTSPEDAEAFAAAEGWHRIIGPEPLVTRYVHRKGSYFRVVEPPDREQPGTPATVGEG